MTVALDKTVLPPESLTVTTGWVLKAAPEVAPDAEVVTTKAVAAPTVGVMLCVVVMELGTVIV